jgi:hypothetical protein
MSPYHLIPWLETQLVHIQLHRTRVNRLPHNRWRKIVRAMQRNNDAPVDLFVNGFEAVEV